MSKQRIWSTGIIVAWTPAIYICPGWMWKAPPMFKIPAPPHHLGNLCYHLLWPTICRCYMYYRCWWFRMCCLINKLHMGPCNPTWTWRAKSYRLGMVTDIKYVHFYVKFIQYSPVCSLSPKKYSDIFDNCRIWSGNPETMVGCVKQLQVYIVVSQALP